MQMKSLLNLKQRLDVGRESRILQVLSVSCEPTNECFLVSKESNVLPNLGLLKLNVKTGLDFLILFGLRLQMNILELLNGMIGL